MFSNKVKKNKGFTLIEVIVSISIFTLVMVISTGAILSVFDANRKAQNLRSVMDNLNLTIESMTRTIRFGTEYHCDFTQLPITTPRDCTDNTVGSSSLVIYDSYNARVVYRLNGTAIERSLDGGVNWAKLTSSDVSITNLTFRVYGAPPYSTGTNILQPRVIIVVSGWVGSKQTSRSSFTLQTTVSQRIIDSQ